MAVISLKLISNNLSNKHQITHYTIPIFLVSLAKLILFKLVSYWQA